METLQQEDTIHGNNGVLIKWGPRISLQSNVHVVIEWYVNAHTIIVSIGTNIINTVAHFHKTMSITDFLLGFYVIRLLLNSQQ